MNAADLEKLFRYQLDDTRGEYLVPQPEFLTYLNEAQEEAVTRGDLLFDNSSSFCTIPIVADVATYSIHCSLYAITFASVDGGVSALFITDRYEMDRLCPEWRSLKGDPKYLMQYENNNITLSPTPDKALTLTLEGYRMPIKSIDSSGDSPEIHRKHHKDLLNWVLHRVYSRPDVDIYNEAKAKQYLDKFERIFGFEVDSDNKRDQHSNVTHHVKAIW